MRSAMLNTKLPFSHRVFQASINNNGLNTFPCFTPRLIGNVFLVPIQPDHDTMKV